MTTQSLDLNLIPKGISPRLYVSQYDKGQTWTFNIYAGNTAYTIPNGATVTIQGTKPDKTGFQYSCTASGNVVTATEQQQMTVIAGEVPAEIRITNNNEIIATLNFILVVEPAALTDETEISETDLPIIEQAIEMFPHYQEMIDDVSSDIATLSNVRAKLGAHNLLLFNLEKIKESNTSGTWVGDTYSIDGLTATFNSDGTISLSGSVSEWRAIKLVTPLFFEVLPADTYTLTGCPSGGSSSTYALVAQFKDGTSTSNKTLNDYGSGATDTYGTYVSLTNGNVYLSLNPNIDFTGKTFKPMLRLASDTDSTYQPYAKPNTELTKETKGLIDNQFANGAVNLLENKSDSVVLNGITWTKKVDGTLRANGTATSDSTYYVRTIDGTESFIGKRVKVSGCPSGGSPTTYTLALYRAGSVDGSIGTYNENGNGVEFDWLNNGSGVRGSVICQVRAGVTVNNIVFKPMITLADMPNSDYAHYVPYAKSNKTITDILTDLIKIVTIDDVTTSSSGNILLADYIPSGYNLVNAWVDSTAAQGVCISSYTYYQHNPILRVLNGNGDVLANATVRIVLEFVKYNT